MVVSLNSRLESNKEEEEDRSRAALAQVLPERENFIELMTSDRKLKASREGSK